jgi:uncharacterized protein (DUF1015 family)
MSSAQAMGVEGTPDAVFAPAARVHYHVAMPAFSPFRGLRYDPSRADLADVTAPPYDVIDAEQRAELVARHPDNVVRIDLPATEDGVDPYEVAPALLARWQAEGLLRRDDTPCLYVYGLEFVDDAGAHRTTLGVMGALTLERPGEGGILPHEHTTPKAKSDRLRMLQVCEANLSAVWGLVPADGLTALLRVDHDPVADFTDDDGVRHRFWVVDEPGRVEAIAAAVSGAPCVIADGHHRYETSLAYRDERLAADGPGPWEAAMVWAVELAEDQLCVRPIHRLVGGLPEDLDLRAALEPFFSISPLVHDGPLDDASVAALVDAGALALVTASEALLLRPHPGAFDGVRDLDTVRLDTVLATLPDHDLSYQHGVDNVVRRVAKGDAQWGVLLRPASVAQILEIAHGGERMPPKTTFFHPKPRTGLVIRPLDD